MLGRMSLNETVMEDLKTAMKARDEVGKRTLRMLKSELGKKEIDLGRALTDDDALGVLTAQVKARRDSIEAYDGAGRKDLADAEREELVVLERYLPKQLDEAEARAAIEAIAKELGLTSKKEMGRLMKEIMARHKGAIDGKVASKIAGQLLG